MNYALVTGAADGLGKALAKELASRGVNLALTSPSAEKLSELAEYLVNNFQVDVRFFAADLLLPQAVDHLLHWLHEQNITVRILVNNAAMAQWGRTDELPMEAQTNLIRLNQLVLFELCYKLLPEIRNQPNPHILNVAGIEAFQPAPFFAVYAATKAFVLSFSRALRHELRRPRVNVSCLCPGPTDSDFFENAGFFKKNISQSKTIKMTAETVAREGVDGLFAKQSVIIPGFSNKLGAFLSRHMPAGMMIRIAYWLLKK